MKFGKCLSNQIEQTFPEWRDKFISYKDLKKRLNSIACDESEFVGLLEAEVEKFNSFFLEKEEDYIIHLKILQERVASSPGEEDVIRVRKEVVDFHGDMVLLENYSALNYTGLVKILKKYDKRTGALLRLPFIRRVLQQPFFTMDLLYELLNQCEALLDRILPNKGKAASASSSRVSLPTDPSLTSEGVSRKLDEELAQIEQMHPESLYMKSTISALRVLKDIRSRSSTVSAFSLPPLELSWSDEPWNKTCVLEQVAE
ncbi:hypothetical protein MLD38_006827 [Melastoma candidum]|uniref:Uncharacterized protein n=1 Tax=Melastoma candidum TaxID=119954 RepID=A0ACB9RPN6_9MYRT|nr:hypothetical protein MLD38_006827 [Melastoma candidum]